MKRVFIIHGWDGRPDEGCFPWLKKRLEEDGFTVYAPAMPDPLRPEIHSWTTFLKDQVGVPDGETILVGHSIGAQTVLRFLASLSEGISIGGVVLLAPWVHLTEASYESEEDRQIARPWLETPMAWEEIKTHCPKFISIFSDDDPLVPLSDAQIFKDKLGATIVIENNKEHFSGSSGIKELPSLLKAVLEVK